MLQQHCVPVTHASHVGEVRRLAARLAAGAGLNESQCGAVAIAATELATNLSRYASAGRVLLQQLTSLAGACVELLAVDGGPGMDIDRCLTDGYSTGGTSGTGLGAVKRLADTFDAYSRPGSGSVVVARFGNRSGRPSRTPFRWGAVSAAAPDEQVCGDAWSVAERDDELSVMIADGLGHGPHAAEAANRAVVTFARHAFDGPASFCTTAHHEMAGTRGAAVALAHVTKGGPARYGGIGNISGAIVANDGTSRGLISQNGTVGYQIRTALQHDHLWPAGAHLIMHSDGLTSRWVLSNYPGLLRRHPAVIAGVLYRDYLRGRDDATVVVIADEAVG